MNAIVQFALRGKVIAQAKLVFLPRRGDTIQLQAVDGVQKLYVVDAVAHNLYENTEPHIGNPKYSTPDVFVLLSESDV